MALDVKLDTTGIPRSYGSPQVDLSVEYGLTCTSKHPKA